MDNLVRGFAHRREVDWTRGVGAASRRLTRTAVDGLRTTGCLQGKHACGWRGDWERVGNTAGAIATPRGRRDSSGNTPRRDSLRRPASRLGCHPTRIVGDAGGVACAGRAIGVAVGGSCRVVGALTTASGWSAHKGARAAEFPRGVPAEPVAEASALQRVRAGVFFTLPDALPRGPHNLTGGRSLKRSLLRFTDTGAKMSEHSRVRRCHC